MNETRSWIKIETWRKYLRLNTDKINHRNARPIKNNRRYDNHESTFNTTRTFSIDVKFPQCSHKFDSLQKQSPEGVFAIPKTHSWEIQRQEI